MMTSQIQAIFVDIMVKAVATTTSDGGINVLERVSATIGVQIPRH